MVYATAHFPTLVCAVVFSLRGLFEDSCAEGGAKAHSRFGKYGIEYTTRHFQIARGGFSAKDPHATLRMTDMGESGEIRMTDMGESE